MKTFTLVSALAVLNAVKASPTQTEKELPRRANSLPAVSVSGNAFYAGDERFFVRGIDYQPGGSSGEIDPLADSSVCERDIKLFKDLGVNTVRVYMVDNSKNHDACMTALNDAGIYLVLDVNTPHYSLNRDKPKSSYNTDYLQNVFATVEMFAKYDNTLAFFSGNEVINEKDNTTVCAPYIKAVTRDMKDYMNQRGLRHVPVGYSAADVAGNRMQTAHYMNCGSDNARSDFFAFNDYSWCSSNFQESGWNVKVKNFTDYGLPIFLSEYGCITHERDFNELSALMSDQMDGVYSGGLMYEYSVEGNGFGIVKLKGSSEPEKDAEYTSFKEALSKYPAPTGAAKTQTTTKAIACPTQDSIWEVDPSEIPAIPSQAQKFFTEGAGKGLGFDGPGSQEASDSGTSPSTVTSGEASPSKDAAAMSHLGPFDTSPVVVSAVTLCLTLVGAMLL